MSTKALVEAYLKMKEAELEEKKLTHAQKVEIDVDDDGDIDAKDFEKLRKKASKKKDNDEEEGGIEEENLDEISKKTLGSYVSKAAYDAVDHGQRATGTYKPGDKKQTKHVRKAVRRLQGIDRATKRLAKESTDIVDFHRERNSEIAQRYMEMLETSHGGKQTSGATEPEKIDSKMSGKNKEWVGKHGVPSTEFDISKYVQDAPNAGRATSRAPARPGDNR